MEKNNTVYLLVGPRGSGKSHYARRLVGAQPGLTGISRDEILARLCGSADASPYTGAHYFCLKIMERLLRRKLSIQTGLRVMLDSWTGESEERKRLIRILREHGATRIVALYFITPLELVSQWFWQKPGIAKIKEWKSRKAENLTYFSEDAPAHDFRLFHELAACIDSDGFDEVIRIDPCAELITLS